MMIGVGREVLGQPSAIGQWSQPFPLPLIAIHSALLPTGRVLLFSAEHGVPGIHGWVLDPESLALTEVAPPQGWNPDCAGHSFLGDGRLLVAGGTLGFNPTRGPRDAYLFSPGTQQWTRIADMRRGRWYPTNITLGDGRAVTMSGLNDTDGALNPDIEVWDPAGPDVWTVLGQRTIPYYPYLHLLPSGLVFRSVPDRPTKPFTPASPQWPPVPPTIATARYEAPSVLLPPTLDRVMLIGGYAGGTAQPTHSAEILDLGSTTPAWRGTASMTNSRFEHNAVLLPDGEVLVVGGRSNNGGTPGPVLVPELFNPATETWRPLAPHQVPRRYHSTSILLPDGRVLAAGGDFQPSGEIYSPPYLFRGPRPGITSFPASVVYGGSVELGFTSETPSTNTIVMIRLSSVTHSVNMDQRWVLLGQGVAAGPAVTVPAPASGNVAPPGYYMLFVIDANGVPSVSRMVRVGVPCYANCDGSTTPPILNVLDFSCFLNQFAAGNSYTNCDGSTLPPILNINDFSCFLNRFAAGCS